MWKRIAIAGLVSFAVGMSACASTPQTVYLSTSWVRLYHDIGSLKSDADLVVSGQITAEQSAINESPPATDFTFAVYRVLGSRRDAGVRAGSSIIVHQTGGIVNGQTFVVRDDPRFRVSDKDILFLRQYAPGRYFVLGGPSGRFQIGPDGLVRPVNNEGVALAPTSESAFERQVQG